MATVSLARQAMATRFEIVLHGGDAADLRAAGEAALDEVERLEARLSLYRPGSEIAQVNARADRHPVQVSPEVFDLLQQAGRLARETGGAFDITVAPLLKCWGFLGGGGRVPLPAEIAAARELTGWEKIRLDAENRTVQFARAGMMLDLGAIGKGFAVERAAALLREAGVASGLVHGGTSTIAAIGRPPEAAAWQVVVDVAAELNRQAPVPRIRGGAKPPAGTVSGALPAFPVSLTDECLSVSAPSGRQFAAGGKRYGHVLDPRTGEPTAAALLAAVVLPSATETDALSTALLVMGPAGRERLSGLRGGLKSGIVHWHGGAPHFAASLA